MAPIPIGFDPMLAAKCVAPVFVPDALLVGFGAIAVAAVVFVAVLPLAFRDGSARPMRRGVEQPPVPRRRAIDTAATSEEDAVPVAIEPQVAAVASHSARVRRGASLAARLA